MKCVCDCGSDTFGVYDGEIDCTECGGTYYIDQDMVQDHIPDGVDIASKILHDD